MSRSLNKAELIGYLGRDPELRYTAKGTAVVSFSVATTERFKGGDGDVQERTTWHNIVAFDKIAEVVKEHLKKGARVYLAGTISNRKYTDKNGEEKFTSEIVMKDLIFLDAKKNGGGSGGNGAEAPQPAHEEVSQDDLPF